MDEQHAAFKALMKKCTDEMVKYATAAHILRRVLKNVKTLDVPSTVLIDKGLEETAWLDEK